MSMRSCLLTNLQVFAKKIVKIYFLVKISANK